MVDFNVLDPDCVIKSIKALQPFLHEDKDAVIGPAIKVIDSLSLLPSQAAEQYMVDFAKDTYDIVESNVLLNKLAEKVVKKQDSSFWLYTL